MTVDFFSQSRAELERTCGELRVPAVHGRNLFRAAFKDLAELPWASQLFPKVLRNYCESQFSLDPVRIGVSHISAYDMSVKFEMVLGDGERIETVLMPEAKRITICVSSQVGCRQACTFCHTGRMGLRRNLTAGEIVGQLWAATQWLRAHPEWLVANRLPSDQRVTNMVFMGMGEPLDNPQAVIQSIRILTDVYGLGIALRRISVSTAGHLDGLEEVVREIPDIRLALSVHSTDERERSRIMPINRRWPLGMVLERFRALPTQQENGLLLQYTLIKGVNDQLEHARRLVELTAGMNVKVNLIPFNRISPSLFDAPSAEHVTSFRDVIHKAGVRVMIRYSKGQDIGAACGQLVM